MHKFYNFFNYVFIRDCSNQLSFCNEGVPKLKKIIVQISFKSNYFKLAKIIAYSIFVVEYLTNQKATFSFSKKDVSAWRLRKKQLVSVFVTLRGVAMFSFFEKALFTFFVKLKNFSLVELSSQSATCLIINNYISFTELEREAINLTKKNSFLGNCRVSVIFVFNAKGKDSKFSSSFLLSQLQIINNKT